MRFIPKSTLAVAVMLGLLAVVRPSPVGRLFYAQSLQLWERRSPASHGML